MSSRFFGFTLLASLIVSLFVPSLSLAASAGIFPSGGTSVQNGQTFTVTVKASGATFDSLQGTISVSGPVSVVSFSAGGATWLPGKAPGNGSQFVGIVSPTSSLTVATIKLKGTKEGSGSVSVSGVRLARSGAEVGTSGGSTGFTITRALTPPGAITVTSTTHPDPNIAYEAKDIELSWTKASGVTGFSYLLDDNAETTPPAAVTSAETSTKYIGAAVGTHYFHIRALNGDGWGSTTHFKITVKEPDAKVDANLAATTVTSIRLTDGYVNDIEKGTISGLLLEGTVPAGYAVTVALTPKPELPAETKLTTDPSEDGSWHLQIDAPIPAGFYSIVAQGQKDKTLTPASEPRLIQLSVANGGSLKEITAADKDKPTEASSTVRVLGMTLHRQTITWLGIALGNLIALALLALGVFYYLRRRVR